MHTVLQPESWAKPKGYANGIAARGGSSSLRARLAGMRNASSKPAISMAKSGKH